MDSNSYNFLLHDSGTAEAASDGIKALLFDGKIVANNVTVQLNADNPLLNFNGRVYVPVRQISRLTGAAVGYDGDSRTIYIDSPAPAAHGIPAVKSEAEEDTFTLKLYSAKSVYKEGEAIQVWGRVVREHDEPVKVYHGSSLVQIILADSEGTEAWAFPGLSLETTTFAPDDEYVYQVDGMSLLFNFNKNGSESFEEYYNEAKRPGVLPKGTYTIEAAASYSLELESSSESRRFLKASIVIEVE